jgi:uroporphyrinogen III methyltransferase/synthase
VSPLNSSNSTAVGTVFLVGAGPGDPGLVAVKGLRYIETADVVVYDRLVDPQLLVHAPQDAEMFDVGKVSGGPRNRQSDINSLLIEKARKGKRVVRLKGGDPFIFGRGGEEVAVLVEAGVPFEVVPGITSAIAVPTYAGIPLTQRGVASSLTIVTGSESPDKADSSVDWNWLAKSNGTLSILMGWENLPSISRALIDGGRPGDSPVAVIQWGTRSNQKTVVGTLAAIADEARHAGLSNPVVVVVGDVVNLREVSQWFDNKPLFHKRVLVTRSRTQASGLVDLLSKAGAEPIELPTIEIQRIEDFSEADSALTRLMDYDWAVFTSINTVETLFERLDKLGQDTRALRNSRVAAIGKATADALKERGIVADLVSRESISQSLIDGIAEHGVAGRHILLPGAETRPERLTHGLKEIGAIVKEIVLYRTVLPSGTADRLDAILNSGVDMATFTSSSTVTNLTHLMDEDVSRLDGVKIACIGPVTAETAANAGLTVDVLAENSTVGGLVEAIEHHYSQEPQSNE